MPENGPSSPSTSARAHPRSAWRKLALALGLLAAGAAGCGTLLVWGLNYQPAFYADLQKQPVQSRQARADRFVSQSLQLRNDIVNEARWEAVFSDEEVNAWLAEDLVTSFADLVPEGVSEPRLLFEVDRVTLAFRYQDGPIRSVVWAIVRLSVPRENEVAITIEKIQAGAFPMPSEQILERIADHARARGLNIGWSNDRGQRVATVRYETSVDRRDVVLEEVRIGPGKIRLAGRSDTSRQSAFEAKLPTGRMLQARFSIRTHHGGAPDDDVDDDEGDQISRRPRRPLP